MMIHLKRSGLTLKQGVAGSNITSVTVLCPSARHIIPCLVAYWFNVQLSKNRHDLTVYFLIGVMNRILKQIVA